MAVVGAGPGGLYLALLLAREGGHDVTVYERHPPGATYGWGVVFSEGTLAELAGIDQPTHAALDRSLVHWSAIDIRVGSRTLRSLGHGFAAISRRALLRVLEERAVSLGVEIRHGEPVEPPGPPGADLLVAADGVNSVWRRRHRGDFRPELDFHPTRYIWLGVDFAFDAFNFIFLPTPHGVFQAHAYPYEAGRSTFIVETSEAAWRAAGLEAAGDDEGARFCTDLFAEHLGGARLLSNRSSWNQFVTLRNRSWYSPGEGGPPVVLVGDAAHTAHFSIGSGTKLAMEDAHALHRALEERPGRLPAALAAYQTEREPAVARFQAAARQSARYFERVGHHLRLPVETFAFNLLTRSGRIGHAEMEVRDPALTMAADRVAAGAGSGEAVPRPALTGAAIGALDVANRLVAMAGDVRGEGLALTPVIAVSENGRSHPGAPWVGDGMTCLPAGAVPAGTRLATVIGHAGPRAACRDPIDGLDRPLRAGGWETWACSSIPYTARQPRPRQIGGEEMEQVAQAFAGAAARARAWRSDLLMVDAARGGLLAGFISPLTNLRSDRYGGEVRNRVRFPLEVMSRIRQEWAGPLGVRLSVTDWAAGGITLEDAVETARLLVAGAGLCLVEVVGGGTVAECEPDYRRGYLLPLAAEVRQGAEAAVLVGGIDALDDADTAIAAGRADLVRLEPYRYRRSLWR